MAVVTSDPLSLVGPPSARPEHGWQARLRIDFSAQNGRTRISGRSHQGPLLVQKPFYPEGEAVCHAYIVHPPGGVVGGDELTIRIDVTDSGHALVTTPAAAKLYRSAGRSARIDQKLTVSGSSVLEWLPQETIAFDRSLSSLRTRVVLEDDARFIGWDIVALGRPAASEAFERGRLEQRLDIRRAGVPLLNERLSLTGGGPELQAPWGLAGYTTSATLIAVHPSGIDDDLVSRVREMLSARPVHAAASVVSEALVVRVLADGARRALDTLIETWSIVRPTIIDRPAEIPRIWAT
jgi:urease accessory protein